MKKLSIYLIPAMYLALMLLNGCITDKCTQTVTYYTYEPVYKSMEEIRAGIKNEPASALKEPGKLYFKDTYIYIVEVNKGVHVIDNADPHNPDNFAFITVPGVRDISIRGNSMYVDSYLDLVTIDITNPNAVSEQNRVENVFPYGSWHDGLWAEEDKGIAVDWIETEHVEEAECGNNNFAWDWLPRNGFALEAAMDVSVLSSNSNLVPNAQYQGGSEVSTGVGGSMARFTISGEYMYAVTEWDMKVFNISNISAPRLTNELQVGWGIETIFPMGNHLYIGSSTGMYIMGLSNPEAPEQLSMLQHVRSCDPVVVDPEENYAYVTIRDGNTCEGTVNQLIVTDISNKRAPFNVATYDMHNPHGLGLKGDVLFICDGDDGLKVFDASDVKKITNKRLAHFKNINTFDVIPLHNILLMIGSDGFYQYDYSDLDNIKQISMIPVERK